MLFCFGLNQNQGGKIEAAEEEEYEGILIEAKPVGEEYTMMKRKIFISYQSKTIPIGDITFDVATGNGEVIEKIFDKTSGNTYLKAIGVGEAIIQCKYDGKVIDTCSIWVKSAFYQNELFVINEGLSEDTIVLDLQKKDTYLNFPIELMFKVNTAEWKVISDKGDGSDVVRITGQGKQPAETGDEISYATIEPVGTGKAKIELYYTEEGGTGQKIGPFSIDVYVGPQLTINGSVVSGGAIGTTSKEIKVKSGDYVNPGTKNSENDSQQGQELKDKIEWVIADADGEKITDSNSKPLEILTYEDIYSTDLKVEAKAGTYNITFATKGCLNLTGVSELVKTYQIIVYATPEDKSEHLQVGDSYDLSEVFNIAPGEFEKYFTISEDGKGQEYGDAFSTDNINGIIKIDKNINQPIELVIEPTDYGAGYIEGYKGEKYKVTLNVFSEFMLNYSNVEIPLNGSGMQLKAYYNNEYTPYVTWSVAEKDKRYVSVDKNGNIKALAVTTTSAQVIATIKVDGRILNAVCRVSVYNTATKIELNKDELHLIVNGSDRIDAEIIINTSSSSGSRLPKLEWLVEDEKIAKITNINDTTTQATFEGLKAGVTTVTVINTENYKIAAYCKIFVTAPINSIKLKDHNVTVYTKETYKLEIASTEPAEAKETGTFGWETSDSTIAEVSDYGVVTFKNKAGEVRIRVYDKSGTSGVAVYDTCTFVVKEAASGLNLPANLTLESGQQQELLYTVSSDVATTEIEWFSLDSSVVSFTSGGAKATTKVKEGEEGKLIIKGGTAGKTFIVAKTLEGHLETCIVTVTQKASGVKLDTYNLTLAVGESYTVTATPNPANATNATFTWSSAKPNIASVDANGKITGVAPGSTFITVTAPEGKAEVVYVDVYSKATGMKLSDENITLTKGKSYTLKPVFTPNNVTNQKVTFTSLTPAIASVNEKGKVTAVKAGSTIITAISEDGGHVATCLVTVTEKITSVSLDKSSKTLAIGDTFKLTATVESNSASNPKLKWTTSNKKIATVNQSGKVTAKKPGTVTIKVKVTDGTNKTATCKVKVIKEVTKVTLNKRILTVYLGETKKLKATVKPKNATNKGVKWTSENPEIAEVVGGEVLGLKEGTTKITVTAKDTSKKKATCHVNVIKREEKKDIPVSSILLSAKDITLVKGQSEKIKYTLVPYNHTDKIYFDSTNRSVATVTSAGTVVGRKAGAASIIITTRSGKQESVNVTVLGLNKTKVTMQQYDTETLFVEGVSSGISWFSSNPSIATVQQGRIVARREGSCSIIAKVKGVNLSCQVNVTKIR